MNMRVYVVCVSVNIYICAWAALTFALANATHAAILSQKRKIQDKCARKTGVWWFCFCFVCSSPTFVCLNVI